MIMIVKTPGSQMGSPAAAEEGTVGVWKDTHGQLTRGSKPFRPNRAKSEKIGHFQTFEV